jgi:TonB family protein
MPPGVPATVRHARLALAVSFAFATFTSAAKDYEISAEPGGVAAAAVHGPMPAFPDADLRRGQEGWVRLNFVVTADGRVADPIVVDSSGGFVFERAALDAIADWRFEASGSESANNDIEFRFEQRGDGDRATRNFLRRYRNIVLDLYNSKIDNARKEVDTANDFGGWNLYELTMLSLLNGRVEGAEGDAAGQLEHYRRGLAISDAATLGADERRGVLAKIFEIEFDSGQYGSAAATLERLRAEPGSEAKLGELGDRIEVLERSIEAGGPIRASATLRTPCNCSEGEALWSYVPAWRQFSFDGIDADIGRFEARCDSGRVAGVAGPGPRWSLPDELGSCRLFVFGDEAATFELVEHRAGDADPGEDAVAGEAG